jgi:hypothetical protein
MKQEVRGNSQELLFVANQEIRSRSGQQPQRRRTLEAIPRRTEANAEVIKKPE